MRSAATAASKTAAVTDFHHMRYYTVDEANSLLPTLEPVLEALTDVYIRLQEAGETVRAFEHRAGQNGHGRETRIFDPDMDLDPIRAEMKALLQVLDDAGVVLKDIEIGLIDFPTRLEGRDVYLCWHLGETHVGFWHGVDEGYRDRKPV